MRILNIGTFACATVAVACSSNDLSVAPAPSDAGITTFDTGPTEDAAPAQEAGPAAPRVTFANVYSDIISPICVTCHNPQGIGVSMGHLDMSTETVAFSDLVGVPAMGTACGGMGTRVVAGNAGASILYLKVTSPPCGSRMPLGLNPLSTAQTDEIKTWINGGAVAGTPTAGGGSGSGTGAGSSGGGTGSSSGSGY